MGEERTRHVNVRVIAASNRNLKQEIAAGRFRQDLFYRLDTFPIEVLPLRARPDDIPLLVQHFLRYGRRLYPPCPNLTGEQIKQLQNYDWPGNIRELRNVLERAAIISQGGPLRLDLVLGNSSAETIPQFTSSSLVQLTSSSAECRRSVAGSSCLTEEERKRHERDNLVVALERTGWKIYGRGGAAELLGLKPNTLAARLRVMGIKKPN